jgi:hypothetical protein
MQQAALLFDPPPSKPRREEMRDDGIDRAVSHADRVIPDWSEKAHALSIAYLQSLGSGAQTTSEKVRIYAERAGLPHPPDKRAWGAVMLRLARAGRLRKRGWTTAEDPKVHCNPVSLWEIA